MSVRRVLITGCSGAGKSALVTEMRARGHEIVKEPGRRVIRAEERIGGNGTPWDNEERFARLCLKMASADWDGVRVGTVIFDRGAFDAAAHLARLGFEDEALRHQVQYRYDLMVMAPPSPDLFRTDPDRRHGFADAVAEYEALTAAAPRLGYTPEILPEGSVAERADWLEALIDGTAG